MDSASSALFEILKICFAQQYFDKKQWVIVIKKSYVLLPANQSVNKSILIEGHLNVKSLTHKGETSGGDPKFHEVTPYKFQPIYLKVISNYKFASARFVGRFASVA